MERENGAWHLGVYGPSPKSGDYLFYQHFFGQIELYDHISLQQIQKSSPAVNLK